MDTLKLCQQIALLINNPINKISWNSVAPVLYASALN